METTKSAGNAIRRAGNAVLWHQICGISTMCQNGLSLSGSAVIRSWLLKGMEVDPMCVLCNEAKETDNHLFFECRYASRLWSHLLRKNNIY